MGCILYALTFAKEKRESISATFCLKERVDNFFFVLDSYFQVGETN